MRASLLMKAPPVTCAPTTSVRTVCQMMGERRVGCVVVVRDGEVIGIVTDRDIALRVVAKGLSADVEVEGVMTRNVASLTVDADIVTAEATMSRRDVRRLPIVDADGRLHGVISLDDIVRFISRQADGVTDVLAHQARSTS
jgi:CBS domain-containing protein